MNELIIPHLSDYVLSKQRSGVRLGIAPELSWYQLSPPNISRAGPILKYFLSRLDIQYFYFRSQDCKNTFIDYDIFCCCFKTARIHY